MGNRTRARRRAALEQQRGREILARKALAREFDPNYEADNAGPTISPEERRRRDEYRKHLGQWKKLYEG
jgi:hypothetical protein